MFGGSGWMASKIGTIRWLTTARSARSVRLNTCMVEVSKAVFRPDAGLQLLASDQVSPVLQKNLQYFAGLVRQFDTASGLAHLSGGKNGFKRPKAYRPLPFPIDAVEANWFVKLGGDQYRSHKRFRVFCAWFWR